MRFGSVTSFGPFITQEVIIDVMSDESVQYQVTQRLLEPMRNSQGIEIPQEAFFFYGIRGSNRIGTLLVQQETPVMMGRRIVYTSNQTGNSDSFKLAYVLKTPLGVPSGSYRGRIAFTLEPVGGSAAPMTLVLNLFADISAETGFDIRTRRGTKIISLYTSQEDGLSDTVAVAVKGALGRPYRIMQELVRPLESPDGRRLSAESVVFRVEQARQGSGPSGNTPLPRQRDALYTSGERGEADEFLVTYALHSPGDEQAGRYRSRISYTLTGQGLEEPLETLVIEVDVEAVFELSVAPEMGGVIQFRDLKPGDKPRYCEVVLEVKNNTGKEYQVSQHLPSALASRDGVEVSPEYFKIKTEPADTKGKLLLPELEVVRKGDTVLYRSDGQGSADSFKVIYSLDPAFEIQAGDYATQITYSITEL